MTLAALAHAGLEQAINHHISMDPNAMERMAQLHGRVIAIEVLGIGQTFYLIPGPGTTQLLAQYEAEPDCLLRGSPMTITQLRQPAPEQGSSPCPAEMEISGDTELAQRFCSILRGVEIDWERYLSKYTGTLIATEVGKVVRGGAHWGQHIADTLEKEIQEYLQQELGLLPLRSEIEGFNSEVDRMQERLKLLQQKIERLRGKDEDQAGDTIC